MRKFKQALTRARNQSTDSSPNRQSRHISFKNEQTAKSLSLTGFQNAESLFKFVQTAHNKASTIKKVMGHKSKIRIRSPDFSYQKRKFDNALKNNRSDIDCGLDTFSIISIIHKKDPTFSIAVPETIVFRCGFDQPTILIEENKLKITSQEETEKLKDFAISLFDPKNTSKSPGLILKYRGKNRVLIYSIKDLIENFPDPAHDCVIQKFVLPKGLKAIKYRAVVGEHNKIYIFSNRTRLDAKKDIFKNTEIKPTNQIFENSSFYRRSPNVNSKRINYNSSDPRNQSDEKATIFNLFRSENFEQKPKEPDLFEDCKPSTRFLTHEDIERTSLYEGKNQSFEKIINLTKYLRTEIDNYVLEGCKLTELAADFLQDAGGNWFLLKIKYGKTIKTSTRKSNSVVNISEIQRKRVVLRSINTLLNCAKLIF